MSKTFRHPETPRERRRGGETRDFRCRHCKLMVGPLPSGGRHRNHCPYCLHSRHLDGTTPGDRASDCGATMRPVGAFTRRKGEHVVVHRCRRCGLERHNRVAADDRFDLVLALPILEPRHGASRLDDGRDGEVRIA